jgi:signal transduction histidine kinase
MNRTTRRLLVVTALAAGIVLGLVAETAWNLGVDPRVIIADLAVGWAFLAGGITAWARRPNSAAGRLMIAVGIAWFAGTLWPPLEFLHRGPLFHLLATYPTGRLAARPSSLGGRLRLAAVLGFYGINLTRLGGADGVALAFGVALVLLAAEGLLRARGSMRRARFSSSFAALGIGLVVIVGNAARIAGSPLGLVSLFAYDVVLALTAFGLAADLLAGRWSEGLLTRVVVDLGDAANAGTVRDRLARALGDPTLVLGFAVEGRAGSFVDETGQPIAMPELEAGRAVTPMIVSGRLTGLIAHDASVLDDPRLVATISAAAGLALSNSSMQVQVRARVAEVDASRERLVHAADSQRRRLERLLQAGAARRLERVADLLARIDLSDTRAGVSLATLRDDLARARAELADFARGVHPAALTSDGLAAALAELARRMPVRVDLTIETRPTDPLTESTLYFVCSEALANAAKHARAGRIAIDVRETGGVLRLTVSDDGAGGATTSSRGGLRGLADRVEAIGGRFALDSPRDGGTRIVVELPPRPSGATAAISHSPAKLPPVRADQ